MSLKNSNNFFESINLFNFVFRISGVVPILKISSLIIDEDIFFVYFGSNSFPDQALSVLMTFPLIF